MTRKHVELISGDHPVHVIELPINASEEERVVKIILRIFQDAEVTAADIFVYFKIIRWQFFGAAQLHA